MTTAEKTLPALVARPGWVATAPGGNLDFNGYRAAYFDADNDCWVYVGRAFSKSDTNYGLARARAELRTQR